MSATSTSQIASSSTLIEVQHPETPISSLSPVLTHITRTAPAARMIDPMGESFGYTFSSSQTHESRHDQRQSISDVPPPYMEEAGIPLPEYTLQASEPVTLAMYLFKFGFLFPPFWVFGAFILLSPLREPPSTSESTPAWMPEKTEAERQQIIAKMRKVELKWATRCLWALVILTFLAVAGGVATWFILRR